MTPTPIRKITDKALETCTPQELFDYVGAHLLRQNAQSLSETFSFCAYRGEGGLKCAIGACISNDLYDPTIEGECASDAFDKLGLKVPRKVRELANDLQNVHDGRDPEFFIDGLTGIAARKGLVVHEYRLRTAKLVDA